jgi:hypothetical protein
VHRSTNTHSLTHTQTPAGGGGEDGGKERGQAKAIAQRPAGVHQRLLDDNERLLNAPEGHARFRTDTRPHHTDTCTHATNRHISSVSELTHGKQSYFQTIPSTQYL